MKSVVLNFLRSKEERELPFLVSHLPLSWQESYVLRHCPAVWQEEGSALSVCLQTNKEGYFSAPWREETKKALEEAKEKGAVIALSALAKDLPQGILPFADGKKLAGLFAAEGAALWLKRKGKTVEEVSFLLVDGGEEDIFSVLETLPENINACGILTDRPAAFAFWQEEMLAGRGLVLETISSCGQGLFRQADVVISWQKDGASLVYALKKGAFFLDLAGNQKMMERLASVRRDVAAADGFFFSLPQGKQYGAKAEVAAFLCCEDFRNYFLKREEPLQAKISLQEKSVLPIGIWRYKK